jgi:hypothetical protein
VENRSQVEAAVQLALIASGARKLAETMVRTFTRLLQDWEQRLNRAELNRKKADRQIKALGFHDIGHARGELNRGTNDSQG